MPNLLSRAWIDKGNPLNMGKRGHLRAMGYTDYDMERPIIGVCNPWSELNPGHWHFRSLGDAVKRGIWAAGGFPLEFPTISMCEVFHNISTLIYRNLMAIDTEEFIDSMPFDGVVLLSTCDKDVPAQIMGLASANKPAIIVTGGTRLAGFYKGQTIACSTDTQRDGLAPEAKLHVRGRAPKLDSTQLPLADANRHVVEPLEPVHDRIGCRRRPRGRTRPRRNQILHPPPPSDA